MCGWFVFLSCFFTVVQLNSKREFQYMLEPISGVKQENYLNTLIFENLKIPLIKQKRANFSEWIILLQQGKDYLVAKSQD